VSVHPDFGIGMNAETPNKEASLKFLRWLGTAEFAQLLTDHLSGFFPLSSHEVKVNDPVGQEMLSWRKQCDTTIRLNAEKLNRVWPPMEEELWYVNVRVLDNTLTPAQAAAHIQKIHERNSFVPRAR
jgi:raffinose/stachyose/melibiose transport system substrate-binding protein